MVHVDRIGNSVTPSKNCECEMPQRQIRIWHYIENYPTKIKIVRHIPSSFFKRSDFSLIVSLQNVVDNTNLDFLASQDE